jgi:3-oxoacyl-[acyl-carrier-protein] synthase II
VGLWDLEHSDQLLHILRDAMPASGENGADISRVWEKVLTNVHPLSPLKALPNILTSHIAIYCNARGPSLTVTTACTSSAQAIGEAYRQIALGQADVMITGGSDAMINPYGMVAFSMLGVMSANNDEWQTAARPFDKTRDGFMVGEGASILVLEDAEHCRQRGATALAEVRGYASTNDAYRLTDEPPSAWGSIQAMRTALDTAAVSADSVDYLNAHGTGTQMNDRTETLAIRTVLGRHADRIPISSTKSMVGHLIAAAGAIECASCILSLQHQVVTPTINYSLSDDDCDLDYVPNESRDAKLDVVLSNSFGFGGQNACLVLSLPRGSVNWS